MTSESDILRADFFRSMAVEYIKQWIGTPYLYGGDDFSGFDCNGIIHEVLQAVGIEHRGYDATAAGIWHDYQDKEVGIPYAGCLVFFAGKDGDIEHVGMMINSTHMVHAGGGGRKTKKVEDAVRDNAYIRMDKYDYRPGPYKFADPFKG